MSSPWRYISFVTAASKVMSYPLSTPISFSPLLVSYLPSSTEPTLHCDILRIFFPCLIAFSRRSKNHFSVVVLPEPKVSMTMECTSRSRMHFTVEGLMHRKIFNSANLLYKLLWHINSLSELFIGSSKLYFRCMHATARTG